MNRQIANQTQHKSQTSMPVSSNILQRKCACGNHTMAGGGCAECGKTKRFGLQTKLKINEPGDIYEQEADRIADQVLAAPAHPAVSGTPPRIQRFSEQATEQAGCGARQRRPRPRQPWQAAGPGVTAGHGAALRPRLFASAGAFRRGRRAIGAGRERPCVHGRTQHCVWCGSVCTGDASGTAADWS